MYEVISYYKSVLSVIYKAFQRIEKKIESGTYTDKDLKSRDKLERTLSRMLKTGGIDKQYKNYLKEMDNAEINTK
jgi:hypothetical protein